MTTATTEAVRIRFALNSTEEHRVNCPREDEWLPILGPTAWLLAQLVLRELGDMPTMAMAEWESTKLARRLGVGPSIASNGNIPRAIQRLVHFGVVSLGDNGVVIIRRGWGKPPRRKGQ